MPALQSQTRTYDAAGNLQTLLDYNGRTTQYTYDSLNRLITRSPYSATDGAPESFTYTPTGKRATMTYGSPQETVTYTYDDHDRLYQKQTPQGTLTYTYDAAGNLASMTSSNANGVSVSYTYDSLNRLATVVDNRLPAGQQTTTYSYDPASNLATVTYPNGLQSSFTYDDLNRVTAMNAAKASYNYQLDATGNRKQVTESSGRVVNWSYDNIYRLTNEAISLDPHSVNGSVGYGLDPVGNRLSQQSSLSAIPSGSYTYDADDRMLSTETYDANGNTLVTGARTFTYDFENRLKTMTMGSTTVTITYDADGNRVAKTVNGVTTRYLVDTLNPTGWPHVVEEVVGGATQRTYTYGRKRISQNQTINGSWIASVYIYDGFGSVRALTGVTGAVTDTYDYDAWGNTVTTTGSTPNVYLYRGEQYDPDLNLYYFRARYLDSLNGRFVSRDTDWGNRNDPITFHRYLYANGDPVDRSDPTGHGSMKDYATLVGSILLPVAPAIERAGVLVRGQMALGVEAIEDAAYWWDLLETYAPGSGNFRTLATAPVLNLANGEIEEAAAISSNRWPPGLVQAIKSSGDIVIKIPWDKTIKGAQHAEQILLEWAKANNYLVLAIAAGGRDICEEYCVTALEAASEAQNAEYGVPIFYVPGGYY